MSAAAQGGRRLRIAIDGPASSGKSTLGALLAARLAYLYFDTGTTLRAYTLLALEQGIAVNDEGALAALACRARIRVTLPTVPDGRLYTVLVEGPEGTARDITWAIRSPAVDAHVSAVSRHPAVRAAAVALWREVAAAGGIVMVGRDIGTVVLPDADLKLFLTAAPEERARRRAAEQRQRGLPADPAAILAELHQRDRLDSEREAAPLRAAPDAVVLDNTHLTPEEELAAVLAVIQERFGPLAQGGRSQTGQASTSLRKGVTRGCRPGSRRPRQKSGR